MRNHSSPELVVAEDNATARNLLMLLAGQRDIQAEAAMALMGPNTKAVPLDLQPKLLAAWELAKSPFIIRSSNIASVKPAPEFIHNATHHRHH